MAAVTTVVRANQILVAEVEAALAPVGLTFARFEIIRLLGFSRTGRLPMGKISERLQVHPASVTSAVKRLERDGLIDRVSDSEDNRVVLANLTRAGREVLDDATARINQVFTSLDLDAEDLRTLVDILNRVRERAGDFRTGD